MSSVRDAEIPLLDSRNAAGHLAPLIGQADVPAKDNGNVNGNINGNINGNLAVPHPSRGVGGPQREIGGPDGELAQERLEEARAAYNIPRTGLHWFIITLILIGETAGCGLIATPRATESAGTLRACILIVVAFLTSAYTGALLGENYRIMAERWPAVYRLHCRRPYPEMARRSVGKCSEKFVTLILNVTQFATGVVFVLLASKNLENFLSMFESTKGFSQCHLVPIVCVCVFPLTLLKSAKDFWPAIVIAMITTTAAVGLLIMGMHGDMPDCAPAAFHTEATNEKAASAFGAYMFAFGGHAAFPSIVVDQLHMEQFTRSVWTAFVAILAMYAPVAFMGAHVYGTSVRHNVILNIQDSKIQLAVNLCISVHVLTAIVIVLNPLLQSLEERLRVPQEFSMKRVIVRGLTMVAICFLAVTVPNFGPLLDLIGSSTIMIMALILPCWFNMYLRARKAKYGDGPTTLIEIVTFRDIPRLPWYLILINFTIIAFGLVVGGMSTLAAADKLANSEFVRPCYLRMFLNETYPEDLAQLGQHFCCGENFNISRFGLQCLDPKLAESSGTH